MMHTKRHIIPTLLLFTAGTALSGGMYYFDVFASAQERVTDRFFLKQSPPEDILIITIDNESIQAIGQWPWPRALFAEALRALDGARIIGIDVSFFEPSRLEPEDDVLLRDALANSPVPVVLATEFEETDHILLRPLEPFREYVAEGFTNIVLDSDGVARTVETVRGGNKSFSALLAGPSGEVPDTVRINYRGPAGTTHAFPFRDLIQEKIPARIIAGKIIIIGATAADLHDTAQTPFGMMSGAELHANVVSTLRDGKLFTDASVARGLFLISIVNLITLLAVYTIKRIYLLVLSLAGIAVAVLGASILSFGFYFVVPTLYLLLGYFLTGAFTVLYQYIAESNEKRFIRKTFQQYLAPDIIEELLEDPTKLKLGGERKKITIVFSDIRGFTTLSESMTPEQLSHILNEYLTAMTDIILDHRGVVDKFIGDAVMAFWGAPLPNLRQASSACYVAKVMITRLGELNTHWQERALPPLEIGIGINTGEVVVGNMGSQKRFDYTLIGDEVNFSSRLEGLNKAYGTHCIISEAVKEEVAGEPELTVRELDVVMVKGKREPKRIFELITHPLDPTMLTHYTRGKEHYAAGAWEAATQEFERALAIQEDGPARTFLERSRVLAADPPTTWNGVYEFTTK